jgi:hypothetical protein
MRGYTCEAHWRPGARPGRGWGQRNGRAMEDMQRGPNSLFSIRAIAELALSRANQRSATCYGSGSAPEPGTPGADVSRATPRRGNTSIG